MIFKLKYDTIVSISKGGKIRTKFEALNPKFEIFKYLFVFLFVGIIFFWPSKSEARTLAWYENLITDGDFTRSNSMSVDQIHNFLHAKGSYLGNYKWGGKSASRWIYDESRRYGINPQVILVTLQKEQSLITQSNPSANALNWAMGYGCYAGGYSSTYKGFGNQIHYAAWMMRYRFDLGSGPGGSHVGDTIWIRYASWVPGSERPVYLSNSATAVMYRYTPYIKNGNYNLYILGRSWFRWSSFMPTLYRIKNGDGKIYLVDSGRKRLVSAAMIKSWCFSSKYVFDVAASLVDSLPTAADLTVIAQDTSTNQTYFMDLGVKRKFLNSAAFHHLGFSSASIRRVSNNLLRYYALGNNIASALVVKNTYIYTRYIIVQGKAYQIRSGPAFKAWGFKETSISTIRDLNYFLNSGKPYGTISYIATDGNGRKYLLSGGCKYLFNNDQIYNHWGYRDINLTYPPLPLLNTRVKAGNLGQVARSSRTKRYYYMSNGYRRWIPSMVIFRRYGLSLIGAWSIDSAILSRIPVGSNLSSL